MKAAMHQTRRHHQKMPAAQLHRALPRKFVSRGPLEQKQQLKTLMRVPRDTAGEVAADPADVDEHRQLDLVAKDVSRFIVHAGSAS